MLTHRLIMTPDHPEFQAWLSLPPPTYTGENALVAGVDGVLRQANFKEFIEYCDGGEYDERMKSLEENDYFL